MNISELFKQVEVKLEQKILVYLPQPVAAKVMIDLMNVEVEVLKTHLENEKVKV